MARSIAARDIAGTAGQLTLTLPAAVTGPLLTRVPAAFHGGINDVLLTGLALAVARLVPASAAAATRQQCGADRSRGPRPRGGVRGRRPVAHGGLVHQPVPGAARSRGARSGGGAWRAGRRSGVRSRRSRSSCGRCPTTGSATGCCATSTRETAPQLAGLPAPQIGFNYLGRFAACRAAPTGRPPARRMPLWRRRSRDAAGARARGQRAHARRSRWPDADGELDLGAGAADRRQRSAIWRSAGSGRWRRWSPRRAARRRRPHAERPAAGGADAGRDRAAGARSIRSSRTSCRCRRCRRGCCSMRFMMRRRPTSTRCSWCFRCRAGSMSDALKAAAQALLERHASLRAGFRHEGRAGRCR